MLPPKFVELTALLVFIPVTLSHAIEPAVRKDIEWTSPPSPLVKREVVCRREEMNVAQWSFEGLSGSAGIKYASWGFGAMWNACQWLNYGITRQYPCNNIAGTIAFILGGIIEATRDLNQQPDHGSRPESRGIPPSVSDKFSKLMLDHGFHFDKIDTFESPTLRGRDDSGNATDPNALVDHFIIRNFQDASASIIPTDVVYKQFVNGTGSVELVPLTRDSNLRKRQRHEGPGLKFSWWYRYWWRAVMDIDAHIFNQLCWNLGAGIAQQWANAADYYGLDDWMGAVGATYYLQKLFGTAIRIIPQLHSFQGSDYEEVYYCGSMDWDIWHEMGDWTQG